MRAGAVNVVRLLLGTLGVDRYARNKVVYKVYLIKMRTWLNIVIVHFRTRRVL